MFDDPFFDRLGMPARAKAVCDAVEEVWAPSTEQPELLTLIETKALGRAYHALGVAVGDRLLDISERDLNYVQGRQSAVAWAAAEAGMTPATASRLLRAAKAAKRLPRVGKKYREGQMTASHLLSAEASMDGFTEDQVTKADALLALQSQLTLKRFIYVCAELRETIRPDLVEEELDKLPDSSRFTISPIPEGVRVGGVVYGQDAEAITAAIGRLSRPQVDDYRDAKKRRADALALVCRIAAGAGLTEEDLAGTGYTPAELPPVAVEIIVDIVTLRRALERERAEEDARLSGDYAKLADPFERARAGAWLPTCEHELVRGAHGAFSKVPVGWRELVSAFCDGDLHRLVLDAASGALELGRDARLFSRRQRRALRRGDLSCQWPGCDNPWVEADHIKPFSQGGRTDVDNGRLLCTFHHKLRHRGWTLEVDDSGTLVAIAPPDWDYQVSQSKRRRRPPRAA